MKLFWGVTLCIIAIAEGYFMSWFLCQNLEGKWWFGETLALIIAASALSAGFGINSIIEAFEERQSRSKSEQV